MQLLVRQLFTKVVLRTCRTKHNFSTSFFPQMAQIKIGDCLPVGELYEDTPANKINTKDYFANKRVIIFGVPGAFTPGCSKTHAPGYIENADKLKCEQNVEDIICLSVNDPFVLSAWNKDLNGTDKIRMFADPSAKFVQKMDLTIDLPPLGGIRAKRFSMLVDNGVVEELNVEPDGTGLSCSLADKLGKNPK